MRLPSPEEITDTPRVLVDWERVRANIREMAETCAEHGVRLMPHMKTHKSVAVARLQLEAGACGLTCAKIGEAEAMLPSGVRRIFLAHSIASVGKIPRLKALAESLDELVIAVTSLAHGRRLHALLAGAGLRLPALLALDTGLGREGARTLGELAALKNWMDAEATHLDYRGIYTHEGFAYAARPGEIAGHTRATADRLREARERLGGGELWPGCSANAGAMAAEDGITGVRPGAYIYADGLLTENTGAMSPESRALCVAATVVDRPEPGLALIDAGSKVFSSDKLGDTPNARPLDGGDYALTRMSEEHGCLTGPGADAFDIGQTVFLVPLHVCPVVNLTDSISVYDNGELRELTVDARGRVR